MKSIIRFFYRSLVASMLALASVTASAIPFGAETGPIGDPAFSERFNMTSTPFLGHHGWIIGTPSAPQGLLADPSAGPWQKYLYTDLPNNPFSIPQGFVFNIVEVLWAVNAWSSWHEGIVTDGWEWVPDMAALMTAKSFQEGLNNQTPPTLLSGLTVERSTNGKVLNFEFDSLITSNINDTLVVFKQIACTGVTGCMLGAGPDNVIELLEYPGASIPEPATLALMVIGFFAMRARHRQAN